MLRLELEKRYVCPVEEFVGAQAAWRQRSPSQKTPYTS